MKKYNRINHHDDGAACPLGPSRERIDSPRARGARRRSLGSHGAWFHAPHGDDLTAAEVAAVEGRQAAEEAHAGCAWHGKIDVETRRLGSGSKDPHAVAWHHGCTVRSPLAVELRRMGRQEGDAEDAALCAGHPSEAQDSN
eukprot:SAG11_NODE_12315_length_709_cov_1.491803_1_plen_140_part_10